MKLPDYNNRLRVLVATYVTFSPSGTELLVNMGGEQVCMTDQVGSASPTPYPAARAVYLTSIMQTRSLIVNAILVKGENDTVSLAFPDRCPKF